MNKVKGSFTLALVATLGLACSGTGLGASVPGKGGQSGSSASGGTGSGGVLAEGGSGGASQASGGSAAGGTTSTGGILAAGGRGGSNAGGSAAGGAGGAGGATSCSTLVACPAIACLYGNIPNPDPCGCPICAGPDAGIVKDASPDGPCLAPPCALPLCGPGQVMVTPTCGCATCVSVDGGQTDAVVCPPVNCPAIKCTVGIVPSPDPCGCPTCAPVDAGPDTKADATKLACVDLDECSCMAANNCRVLSDACYCPFPQCGSGACVCGGGKFLGCAPTNLATCADAKARVGTLCPRLSGATFDNLCSQTNTACTTKCSNDVASCGDVGCAFCEACDCATDNFLTCIGKCNAGVATKQ